jgi:predicted RNA-binding protein with PUA-like domain
MANWLLKTEPDVYSYDDLARDKQTCWDGVSNALALKHIRAMSKGDTVIIYHTGDERQVVGLGKITRPPYPDPKLDDEKRVVVDIRALKKFANPVGLDTIKSDKRFEGWDLLRIGRLSVVPTSQEILDRLIELGKGAGK